jgi:predicted nucleotidyltransferase
MDRTALVLTRDEWQAYHPGARVEPDRDLARWERALEVARVAADVLRRRFGATQVVAFGSLVCQDCFGPWSDIDLAARGIPSDLFYRAVATVTGISAEFKIDLVAPEDCRPALRRAIEREGITL